MIIFSLLFINKKDAVRNRDFHSRYRYFLVMRGSDAGSDTDKYFIAFQQNPLGNWKISDARFLSRYRRYINSIIIIIIIIQSRER